jgi:cellulose biosynthesis protein BcsQ
VSVVSNKGGVGKTTIATNLAVYVRALHEELPILVIGLDDQNLVDRMFALEPGPPERTIADALLSGDLLRAVRLGQYGVHYVPSPVELSELRERIRDPLRLRTLLEASGWPGLVILDTKSDLDVLTRNAIAASDLTLVVVKDHQSLLEADKVFGLIEDWGADRECARIVLSLVDRRVKYEPGQTRDILALLVMAIRERDYPLFQTFVSRSPKIESLHTNERGAAVSILNGAPDTLVHEQMRLLAIDVLATLDADAAEPEHEGSEPERNESCLPLARAHGSQPLPYLGFVSHLTLAQREGTEESP